MKKRLLSTSIALAVVLGLFWFSNACGKKNASGEMIQPYRASSFAEVTRQLNPNGSFFLYAGTDQWVKWVNDLFEYLLDPKITATMGSNPEKAVAGIRWFRTLLTDSGVLSVDGIGISSVPIAEQLHHSTVVIHRSKTDGSDLISRWSKQAERPLDTLKFLPDDTVFASFSDHALAELWQWLDQHIGGSEIGEMASGWNQMKLGMASAGIDLQTIFDSLGRKIGLVVTLDREKSFPVPGDISGMTFPAPGLALIVDTKDDTVFNLFQKFLPMAELNQEDGYKTLTMPDMPLPFDLKLKFCQGKDRFILASNSTLLETLKKGAHPSRALTDTAEFKEMSQFMPDTGNGFRYLSSRLWDEISKMVKSKLEHEGNNPSAAAGIGFLTRLLPSRLAQYSVIRHQGDSINIKMNHSFSAGHLMLLPAVTGVGIISAIAIPNLIRAREQAAKIINEDPGSQAEETAAKGTFQEE